MNTYLDALEPLNDEEYLLLQHLQQFKLPFYKSDVYLTFLAVVPNLTQFNKLFLQFRLRGFVYSLNRKPLPGAKQAPDSPETLLYTVSAKGLEQLNAGRERL